MASNFEDGRGVVGSKNIKRSTELCLEDKVEMQENQGSVKESQLSMNYSTSANKSFELDEEIIIISRRDIERLTRSLPQLESFDRKLGMENEDKKYEEWVYVETDRSTFKVREDLLLLSSVYDDERPCCVLQ